MIATDELQELEAGVALLRRRPVKIVIIDRLPTVPMAPSDLGDSGVPAVPRSLTPSGDAAAHVSDHRGDQISTPSAGSGPDSRRGRRGFFRKWRTQVVDATGAVVVAGTFLPAFVTHGNAQGALMSIGSALLGTVAARLINKAAGRSDAP
jgi:hypothetical protein